MDESSRRRPAAHRRVSTVRRAPHRDDGSSHGGSRETAGGARVQDRGSSPRSVPSPGGLAPGSWSGWSHQEIAERLGIYRETVTYALNELKVAGIIETGRRRISVLDDARAGRGDRWQLTVGRANWRGARGRYRARADCKQEWSASQIVEHVARSHEASVNLAAGQPSAFPKVHVFAPPAVAHRVPAHAQRDGVLPERQDDETDESGGGCGHAGGRPNAPS